MQLKKNAVTQSGRNGSKNTWSVKLEIPFFGIEEVDGFYKTLSNILTERAMAEGLNVFSFLTPCYVGEDFISLYLDILFCRGRTLLELYRVGDNRAADGMVVAPPRGAKNGGWCYKSGKYYSFKSAFKHDPDLAVKRNEYPRYISVRELGA